MNLRALLVIAGVAICGNADATSQDSSNLMGLTKSAVVQRLGFPTNAHLVPSYAQGGPGYEIWQYYQRSPSGTVEIKDVVFGNQPKNLGHVVSYSSDINPKRIISAENWEGLRAIMDYNSKHGM